MHDDGLREGVPGRPRRHGRLLPHDGGVPQLQVLRRRQLRRRLPLREPVHPRRPPLAAGARRRSPPWPHAASHDLDGGPEGRRRSSEPGPEPHDLRRRVRRPPLKRVTTPSGRPPGRNGVRRSVPTGTLYEARRRKHLRCQTFWLARPVTPPFVRSGSFRSSPFSFCPVSEARSPRAGPAGRPVLSGPPFRRRCQPVARPSCARAAIRRSTSSSLSRRRGPTPPRTPPSGPSVRLRSTSRTTSRSGGTRSATRPASTGVSGPC